MKTLLLISIGIGFAFIHGICEGIIMWQPNPREHLWYGLYHRLTVARLLFCALFFIWVSLWCGNEVSWLSIAGIALLGWQSAEIGYGISRHGNEFPDEENVFGTGFRLTGIGLGILNFIRVVGGTALLVKGWL